MTENTSRKVQGANRIILFSILLIILAAGGLYLYAGWIGYQEAPKRVELEESKLLASAVYTLSLEQENNLLSYGYPEAFTILFYQEETSDQGIEIVRLETWEYYSLGFGVTFINGELVSQDPIDWDSQDSVFPAPYHPEQFSAFMKLAEVISAGGIETYIEIPLNKELMDEGRLYYADSLSFGLKDNQLVYIEAMALIEE